MATGKSTVGKQLAEQLARPFVDLDLVIEQKTTQLYGMSINKVFQHLGESVFRRLEYEILQDLLKDTERESVIAWVAVLYIIMIWLIRFCNIAYYLC